MCSLAFELKKTKLFQKHFAGIQSRGLALLFEYLFFELLSTEQQKKKVNKKRQNYILDNASVNNNFVPLLSKPIDGNEKLLFCDISNLCPLLQRRLSSLT